MDKNIDSYIVRFPKEHQKLLNQLRTTMSRTAPKASEMIAYGVPTFVLNGNLVHFGAFKNHIGFYPTPSALIEFKEELSKFKSSKGSVQFKIDEPLPLTLIAKIVKFRVKENALKVKK